MQVLSGEVIPPKLNSGEICGHLNLGFAISHIANKFPDQIAITYKDTSVTFLAVSLKQLGLSSGHKIAILMERSEKMIVSILAILKLGCTYIPIDVEYPKDRINFILEDSNAIAIIVGNTVNYDTQNPRILSISENIISFANSQEANFVLPETTSSNDLAYIIYTSGSTGKPKGVQVTHANVHNYAYWFCSEFGMTEADSIDFSSTLAFDLSVTSTIVPLLCGARIQICPQSVKALPHKYLEYIKETEVSFIKLTPSYFGQITALLCAERAILRKLTIVLGGEALVPNDLKEWFSNRHKYWPLITGN